MTDRRQCWPKTQSGIVQYWLLTHKSVNGQCRGGHQITQPCCWSHHGGIFGVWIGSWKNPINIIVRLLFPISFFLHASYCNPPPSFIPPSASCIPCEWDMWSTFLLLSSPQSLLFDSIFLYFWTLSATGASRALGFWRERGFSIAAPYSTFKGVGFCQVISYVRDGCFFHRIASLLLLLVKLIYSICSINA